MSVLARISRRKLILLLVAVAAAGGFLSWYLGLHKLPEKSASQSRKEPVLAEVEARGKLTIDLGGAGNRIDFLKQKFVAGASPKIKSTLEKLIRRQAAMTYLHTIFREPALPIPFDEMILAVGERSFDTKRQRIIVPYVFSGYIAAPAESFLESLPGLEEIDSVYAENFIVPADPRNLFQRLGYACANQDEVPLGAVDDKNYSRYFDAFCAPDVQLCVHPRGLPLEPCIDVLSRENGVGAITIRFHRVAYDESIAKNLSKNHLTSRGGADLTVDAEGLADHDIVYKKFEPDSCVIAEKCVGGPGMRRLLRFSAVTPNSGDEDIAFGDVQKLADSNQFVYSECHKHYHFNGYGEFSLSKDGRVVLPGSKQSFCVESTGRYSNDSSTPFTAPYQTCENQGIVRGWQDEYSSGLDCQWIDITDLKISGREEKFQLAMEVNPLKLLCEGLPQPEKLVLALDESGNQILGPNGKPESKQACTAKADFYKNNKTAVDIEIPKIGSLVNEPCETYDFGPLRNCGWKMGEAHSCSPGKKTAYESNAEMVRACAGTTPCLYDEALFSGASRATSFTCPTEGGYLIMTAPFVTPE